MFKNNCKRFTRNLKVFLSIVRDPGMSKHILNVWPNVLKLFYTFPGLPGNVGNCLCLGEGFGFFEHFSGSPDMFKRTFRRLAKGLKVFVSISREPQELQKNC